MRYLTILALLMIGVEVHAQRVLHGRLLDAESKDPIAGASVEQRTESDSLLRSQQSHANGEFRLALAPDAHHILIHALGYSDSTLLLSLLDTSAVIHLKSSPIQQREVTVTGVRHLALEQDVPVSIAVARGPEIMSRSPQGLDNALRYIPGITMTEDQVSIRGSSGYSRSVGSRVLLLLDGMPMLSADNGDMKFDIIPLFNIDRVEVVKGGGSALYGSSALGGVINVITRKPEATPHGAISLYSGQYDQPKYESWRVPSVGRRFYAVDAGGTTTVDDIGLLGSFTYKRNEGWRLGDDTYRWNGFAKATTRLGNATQLTFSALVGNEDHGGWVYWKSLAQPLMPSDSAAAVNGRIHSFKGDYTLNVSTFIEPDIHLNLASNFFHTSFTTDPSSTIPPADTAGAHSSADAWNGELTISMPLMKALFLTAGTSVGFPSVKSDLFGNRSGSSYAGFAQAEYKPVDEVNVSAGLRFDGVKYVGTQGDNQFSPKFGVTYVPLEGLSLRGSSGSGFRVPTIGERFIESKLAGFNVKPNLDLKPERSRSTEIGFSYESINLSLDGAAFYSTFHDLIEARIVTTTSDIYIQFLNVTSARLAGHEESINWRPFGDKSLDLRLGYTYIYPENTDTHEILQYRPRHVLQFTGTGKIGDLTLGTDFRYISRYETTDSTLSVQVTDGGARVATQVWDVRAGYDLQPLTGAGLTLTFMVQNLLNYYYVEIVGNLAPLRSFSLRLDLKL